jgi:CRP-like cAMP-binding protein
MKTIATVDDALEPQVASEPLNSEKAAPGDPLYRLWASDNQVYGPVTLAVLAEWAADSRVFPDSWIYSEARRTWEPAINVVELKPFLPKGEHTAFLERQRAFDAGIDPDELRLFPALAALSSRDLAHLIQLAEFLPIPAGEVVIQRREPGDSIYFVLSGALYARILVGGQEQVLNRIPAGEFFGEMSMFTATQRTADVIASEDSRLVRFSSEAFRVLITENPAVAAPMLYNISTTMARRIMATNTKFQTEIASGFSWR